MKVSKKVELLMELRESKAKQVRSLSLEVEELNSRIWIELKIANEGREVKNVERDNTSSDNGNN